MKKFILGVFQCLVNIVEKILIKLTFRIFRYSLNGSISKSVNPRLLWGVTPIVNFKYWNEALKLKGYNSKTFMTHYYSSINKRNDFDIYFEDIKPKFFLSGFFMKFKSLSKIHLLFYIADNFDIIHTTYEGLVWKDSIYWKNELNFYRNCGLKFVVLPYGSDYQMYSQLYNKSWHHALLVNYPESAKREKLIRQKIEYFVEYADCIMAGFQFDQISRWDIFPYAVYPMNTNIFRPKTSYSKKDGKNGIVKVYHTPNHRGIKGTEFLIQAVEELKAEGVLVELCLLENVQNDVVRDKLYQDADILVEQLILGFALSALEGMATGLPVITNLEDDENEIKVFRRFSYLNECPALSSNPEKIKETLLYLIKDPELRKSLGEAGVKYVEKYHSYKAMGEIFSAIYDRVWYNKENDLINFFNPNNKDSYNNKYPIVNHPLKNNRIVK